MKRIKAWFLILIMVFSLFSTFVGCTATGADSALSMGQWVSMVADSFGLASYVEEKPYFEKIPSTSSYFPAFQAVAEWEILEPSAEIDEKTPVKWRDVLVSLVNAGEFMDLTASDEDKINYAIEHFDSSIRSYWAGRYIKMAQAVTLLETAQNMWADRRYTEKVEKLTVTEEVVDYMDQELEYTEENDVITIDADVVEGLKPGDVYTLPGTDMENASINRVASIEIVDGKAVITNDAAFTDEEAMDYVKEVVIQETSELDMEKIDGMYDEAGNPIEFTVDPEEDLLADMGIGDAQVVPLSHLSDDDISCGQLGFFDNIKGTLKFEIPDKNDKNVKWVAKITIKKSSMAIKLSREKKIADSTYKEVKQESYIQAGFSNMEITKDVDYSWGKLKSATIKLNYKTEIEGGVSIEKDHAIGAQVNKDGQAAISSAQTVQQFKDAISSMKTSWRDTKNSKADDIYICRLSLIEGGFASVDLIVKGKVTVTGEVKLVVTVTGSTGVQYKNNKVRYIKKSTTDVDFMADGKLEATMTPGIEVTILKKFVVVDFTVDLGFGAAFNLTTHLLDAEGHRLYSGKADLSGEQAEAFSNIGGMVMTRDEVQEYLITQGIQWDSTEETPTQITFAPGFCFDWRVYPIIKINVGGKKSLVGKIMSKFEVEFTYEVFGEDDVILQGHYDFPGNDPLGALKDGNVGAAIFTELLGLYRECSLKNEPWPEGDGLTETEPTETTQKNEVPIADDIRLDSERIFIEVGESYYVTVTALPDGYTLDDLEAVCEKDGIVKFDDQFSKVTGLKEGITQITIRTKDKKFKKDLAITVSAIDNASDGNGGGGGFSSNNSDGGSGGSF